LNKNENEKEGGGGRRKEGLKLEWRHFKMLIGLCGKTPRPTDAKYLIGFWFEDFFFLFCLKLFSL
jgi:hypothetical protein